MKKHSKLIMLILCMALLPLSAAHASINDSTYILFIGAPAAVYAPTLEFEAGNSLKVIGASWEYSELTGIWQEIEFGLFTFFQAQVEQSEPATTTTIPDIPDIPSRVQLTELQPAQAETTKFLINLAGIAFTNDIIPQLGLAIGTGGYLGAEVFFVGFTGAPGPEPDFGSIVPDEGEQGDQNFTVVITGTNTNFVTGETFVSFGQGIQTVGTVDVDTQTELSVQINIDEDATVGPRTVTVTFPGGFATGVNVFNVLEKTE